MARTIRTSTLSPPASSLMEFFHYKLSQTTQSIENVSHQLIVFDDKAEAVFQSSNNHDDCHGIQFRQFTQQT